MVKTKTFKFAKTETIRNIRRTVAKINNWIEKKINKYRINELPRMNDKIVAFEYMQR